MLNSSLVCGKHYQLARAGDRSTFFPPRLWERRWLAVGGRRQCEANSLSLQIIMYDSWLRLDSLFCCRLKVNQIKLNYLNMYRAWNLCTVLCVWGSSVPHLRHLCYLCLSAFYAAYISSKSNFRSTQVKTNNTEEHWKTTLYVENPGLDALKSAIKTKTGTDRRRWK